MDGENGGSGDPPEGTKVSKATLSFFSASPVARGPSELQELLKFIQDGITLTCCQTEGVDHVEKNHEQATQIDRCRDNRREKTNLDLHLSSPFAGAFRLPLPDTMAIGMPVVSKTIGSANL